MFNAGRLDASILLNTEDYFRLAAPEEAPLVKAAPELPANQV